MFALKRVYEPASAEDGFRILTDRLWPRGVSKDRARVDVWLKDVAPSTELRKWFAHDPAKWSEFKKRYFAELADNPAVEELVKLLHEHRKATLLFGSRDEEHNQAVALKEYLSRKHAPA